MEPTPVLGAASHRSMGGPGPSRTRKRSLAPGLASSFLSGMNGAAETLTAADGRMAGEFLSRAAFLLKIGIVIALMAGGCGLGAWYLLSGTAANQASFLGQFDSLVHRVGANLPGNLGLKESATALIAGEFIFKGINTPIAFAEYYYLASNLAIATSSFSVAFAPSVSASARANFESNVASLYEPILSVDPFMNNTVTSIGGIWDTGNTSWAPTGALLQQQAASRAVYFPVLFIAPIINNVRLFLWDLYSDAGQRATVDKCLLYGSAYTTDLLYFGGQPGAIAMRPVYDSVNRSLLGISHVSFYLVSLLNTNSPSSLSGVDVAIESPGGAMYTFRLNGGSPIPRGRGAQFDPGMDAYKRTVTASLGLTWMFHIYPTQDFSSSFTTAQPLDVAVIIILSIAFVCGVFVTYDLFILRQARRLHRTVAATTRLLDDVFPSAIKDRMVSDMVKDIDRDHAHTHGDAPPPAASMSELHAGASSSIIADYYPECTVLFSDIVSFTDWSAVQTPTKVFEVLETMFAAFDAAARRHGVFKVETVGDGYVASAGCPNPSPWHAAQAADMALEMVSVMDSVRAITGVPEVCAACVVYIDAEGYVGNTYGFSMPTGKQQRSSAG